MEKMKQVWFTDKNKVEVRNVEIPKVAENQVKVKIAYAALCATDVHMVTMGVLGAKPPMRLGHEASGIIEELGEGADKFGFKIGDKVSLFPVTSCGKCPACKKGQPQYCHNSQDTGAFAEYVVTDVSAVFKIPDDADLQWYSLVEPANCTVRAMDLAQIKHGDTVAISGVGGIGSILLNMILLAGGAKVTAIDPVESKRQMALNMGAQYVIDPFNENMEKRAMEITDGNGFDYVFEASGSPKAAEPALKIMGKCGTVVYFAVFPPKYEMPLNLYELYMKEGRIQTVFTTTSIMPRTINLIPRLQLDKVIGKVMPLSDAVKGFELFNKSIYPKILFDCSK
ncbi:Sorbitol dehydrogenase [Clostridium ljungdahlii DSM 13528]|uniref:Sorbitol dehydrogenase n=2 Tax=Clostridium TaxID=1485 RepID=D8GM65_CLOLD|nr:zinc-containing alcohol dehydrogenase [Clostridium ljungdahlii DSM 13528]ALU35056.1 Threonine dehydrogenase [Clostridium autoethanogenum DSM 10061]OAA86522.1 Sorbitol dehydrogenase [Clostridium ljungdahlii DSM 13528]OVY49445.1 Sorbitol dehydrogenase [Clostridium autoethanogenum]